VLESSADLFGGDEINRVQSRRFIALLRKLARPNNCAILLISHPSQSGMQSGSGTSGNTAWNNSVRSRMYFRAEKKKDDDEDNGDVRELEFMKNNYGPKDEPVKVIWSNGVYVPLSMFKDTLKEEHRKQEAEHAFMNCLRQQQALNLGEVSHLGKSKSRYAPRIFAGMKPQSQGFNERTLAAAMMRLIEAKKIVVRTGGSKTRPWEYLGFPEKNETDDQLN
jgi:RecA-family ATPase